MQLRRRALEIAGCVSDVRGVAAKLLAERDGYRVLQMRAPRLEDSRELAALRREAVRQPALMQSTDP